MYFWSTQVSAYIQKSLRVGSKRSQTRTGRGHTESLDRAHFVRKHASMQAHSYVHMWACRETNINSSISMRCIIRFATYMSSSFASISSTGACRGWQPWACGCCGSSPHTPPSRSLLPTNYQAISAGAALPASRRSSAHVADMHQRRARARSQLQHVRPSTSGGALGRPPRCLQRHHSAENAEACSPFALRLSPPRAGRPTS